MNMNTYFLQFLKVQTNFAWSYHICDVTLITSHMWCDQAKWVTCQGFQFRVLDTTFWHLKNATCWCKPNKNVDVWLKRVMINVSMLKRKEFENCFQSNISDIRLIPLDHVTYVFQSAVTCWSTKFAKITAHFPCYANIFHAIIERLKHISFGPIFVSPRDRPWCQHRCLISTCNI